MFRSRTFVSTLKVMKKALARIGQSGLVGSALIAAAFFGGASGISDLHDADRIAASSTGAYGTGDYNVAPYNNNTTTSTTTSTTPTSTTAPTVSTAPAPTPTVIGGPSTTSTPNRSATTTAAYASTTTKVQSVTTSIASAATTEATIAQASSGTTTTTNPSSDGKDIALAADPDLGKSEDKKQTGTIKIAAALATVLLVALGSGFVALRRRNN